MHSDGTSEPTRSSCTPGRPKPAAAEEIESTISAIAWMAFIEGVREAMGAVAAFHALVDER